MLSDQQIADLLSNSHTIACVGVVSDPHRESYRTAEYQQSQGYTVIPVNDSPKDMILGHETVQSVADIHGTVDIVDVHAHPQDIVGVTNAAIQAGAKAIWFEQGKGNADAERRAKEAGLEVISNRSFEKEHRRLVMHKPH